MWAWYICVIVLLYFFYWYMYEYDFTSRRLLKQGGIDSNIFKGISGYSHRDLLNIQYSTTYGELMGEGMMTVWDIAVKRGLTDVFLDLGCGIGKCLALAVVLGFKSAIGIEIVKGRYKSACIMRDRLPSRYKNTIEIYGVDVFDYEYVNKKPCMIFISNIMWGEEVNRRLFKMLTETYPRGSYIISSAVSYKDCDDTKYKNEGTVYTPMSWDKFSICHKTLIL